MIKKLFEYSRKKGQKVRCNKCGAVSKVLSDYHGLQLRICRKGHRFVYDYQHETLAQHRFNQYTRVAAHVIVVALFLLGCTTTEVQYQKPEEFKPSTYYGNRAREAVKNSNKKAETKVHTSSVEKEILHYFMTIVTFDEMKDYPKGLGPGTMNVAMSLGQYPHELESRYFVKWEDITKVAKDNGFNLKHCTVALFGGNQWFNSGGIECRGNRVKAIILFDPRFKYPVPFKDEKYYEHDISKLQYERLDFIEEWQTRHDPELRKQGIYTFTPIYVGIVPIYRAIPEE